ncbi:MAG: HlyD family efflux transporter periplasmic adaptor subunit [Bacteroidia bacterium]|nr:HlyD family efflux transporter periplasmic adaptor subunit [Bacteroidia bacterium]
MKNRKTRIILGVVLLAGIAAALYFSLSKKETGKELTARAQKGTFVVEVSGSGELRATNETEIRAPEALRNNNIYQIKISDLVPEGSRVKSGDYIGKLDPTEIQNKLNEEMLNLQKREAEFKQTQLDTTLSMREARDELQNYQFQLKEKRLIMEQSKYEAPAVIQQTQLDLERTQDAYNQKKTNYVTKQEQARTKMAIVNSELQKAQNKVQGLMAVLQQLVITAPEDGMVIYAREWDGKKRTVGASINIWDPQVAALPDLSQLETVTYINEIDISKVKTKQKVRIGLDAAPDKMLTGEVVSVANIGEQRPNSDSKVFEVIISVNEKDSTLRPSMTTSCKINCSTYENVVFVPLESVRTIDKQTFVVVKDGASYYRQQVQTGATNDTHIIILKGLSGEETVLLTEPEDMDKLPVKTI